MNPSPDDQGHRVLRERLGAYALDGLDGAERSEVDAHLAGCASCRAELDGIAPLAGPLGRLDPDRLERRSAPAPAPSPAGFAAILGRLGDDPAGDDVPTTAVPPVPATSRPDVVPLRRRRPSRTTLLVAAAGVAVALAGLGAGFGLGLDAGRGPVEPVAVQALAPGVEADAGTIAHTWGTEVVLTARGFDAGRTYQVAVIDRSGRPVGAGAFIGTGASEMVCRLNSSVLPDQATGFVVTAPGGGEVLRSRFA